MHLGNPAIYGSFESVHRTAEVGSSMDIFCVDRTADLSSFIDTFSMFMDTFPTQ